MDLTSSNPRCTSIASAAKLFESGLNHISCANSLQFYDEICYQQGTREVFCDLCHLPAARGINVGRDCDPHLVALPILQIVVRVGRRRRNETNLTNDAFYAMMTKYFIIAPSADSVRSSFSNCCQDQPFLSYVRQSLVY